MKFKSQVLTQASGSVGGLTYAHNKGGMYTRARSIPTDPASAFQQAMRNAVSQLVTRWSATLTQAQRDAWEVYGVNVPVTDRLGDTITISGLSWYVKCNTVRQQSSLSVIDAAPVVFTRESLSNPSFTATASTDLASVSFTNTDGWANESGGALLAYFSRPQSVGINFFKGPYRFAGKVVGAGTPPTSPASIALPFLVAVGQKVFGRFVAVGSDARTSPPFRSSVVSI